MCSYVGNRDFYISLRKENNVYLRQRERQKD